MFYCITNCNMKELKSNILYIILNIIFAISSAVLSIQLMISYKLNLDLLITMDVSFICAAIFFRKTINDMVKNVKNNKVSSIIFAIFSIMFIAKLYATKGIDNSGKIFNFIFNPFRIRFFIVSSISAIYLGVYIGNKIKKWIIDFYNLLDSWDKKAYLIASGISILVIILVYSFNSNFYLQYDHVYSIDSGYFFNNIMPTATYYNIRHPILSVFTFPVFAIIQTIGEIILPSELLVTISAIIFQIVNAQLLILIGLQIKILTNKKAVFVLYMLSFSTMIYTVFLEKYQICTFLLVLYVFNMCINKKSKAINLISAAGVMPTSSVIGIAELFTKDKITEKLKKIFTIIVGTVLILICLGRINVLTRGMRELKITKQGFSNTEFTFIEKLNASSKVAQDAIIALPSSVVNVTIPDAPKEQYRWNALNDNISWFAIFVWVVTVVGLVKNRKELFTKISSVWLAFLFVLFVVLNWSTEEAPLFTIYFSWAIIPFFVTGLDYLLEKIKVNKKLAYISLIVLMIIVNLCTLVDIYKFLS